MSNSTLIWRITRRCNSNKCIYCIAADDLCHRGEMTASEMERLVPFMARSGIKCISLSGGEPLLKQGISKLLRRFKNFDLRCNLATNGLSINKKQLSLLKKFVSRVKVSLDGLKLQHEKLRGEGTFHLVWNTIRQLIQNSIPLEVCTTITTQNVDKLESFVDALCNIGVTRFQFQTLIPQGLAGSLTRRSILSKGKTVQVRKVLSKIKHQHPKLSIQFRDYASPQERYLLLETDGTLMIPSYTDQSVVGNILKESPDPLLRKALSNLTVLRGEFNSRV